jgi:hypothetical protein
VKSIRSRCFCILIASLLPSWIVAQNVPANENDFARKVKSSYYSVGALGLKRFQCQATPDWSKYVETTAVQYGSTSDSPKARAFLKQLEGIRYAVVVELQDQPKITVTPLRPMGQGTGREVELAIYGVKKGIEASFEMLFSLSQFIDEISAGKFRMTGATRDRYILANEDTELEFDHDYQLRKLIDLPHSRGTYAVPSFTKIENGLFLQTGIELYGMTGQPLKSSVQYEDVQNFKLVSRIRILPAKLPSVVVEVAFSNYHLK